MKTVRLLTAVFLLWTVPALAQTEVNRIYDASEMMDNIEVAKSMEVFGRALSSYSQSYLTNYELGYAYYLQEDYTRAGRIFSRLSRDMSVDDRLYQVWGNSYADRGNDRKAEKIYRRGLKAFPHSGALHMELGALAFKDKRYDEALMYFERGIELDPSYPDNYWRAAGIYLSSPESVWGMIYGEIYMNMVCNGEQNMEVSRLLAEAYDSNIWHEKNDSGQDLIYISFSENNSIWYDETLKVMRFPYGVAVYEPTLGNAVVKVGLPPFSVDNLCRIRDIFVDLDKRLADMFTYLDRKVGKGQYLVFLTADHGAANNILMLQKHGIPAGGFVADKTAEALNAYLEQKFGARQKLVACISNYKVYLDRKAIRSLSLNIDDVKESAVEWLKQNPAYAYVVDLEHANDAPIPSAIRERIINGYHRLRSGDIQIILNPANYEVASEVIDGGTTHGVWNPYDSHIPFILMGWNVSPGKTNAKTTINDIAATVCAMIHIQMPNGCIGNAIDF